MKKVIIEQTGNIIMIALATCMMVYMIAHSYWHPNGESSFQFGIYGILFLAWLVVFGIARVVLAHTDPSFNSKKGELSVADEREKVISQHALRWTYYTIFTLLLIGFMTIPILSIYLNTQPVLFSQITVIAIGSILMVGFATYLSGWLYFDVKES